MTNPCCSWLITSCLTVALSPIGRIRRIWQHRGYEAMISHILWGWMYTVQYWLVVSTPLKNMNKILYIINYDYDITALSWWYIMMILSGWWYTYPSEKSEFVSWGYYSQYMEKTKKCSKPPSSSCSNLLFPVFDCSFGDQPVKSA